MATHRQEERRRLRDNPLCRRSDRVESWMRRTTSYALVVGTLGAAATVGAIAHDAAEDTAQEQRAERQQVSARLLTDAPPSGSESGSDEARYPVPVRWTTDDGTQRTGSAQVPAGSDRGSTTKVWLDKDGGPAAAPMSGIDVWLHTAVAGTVAAGGASVVVCAARGGVGWLLDRRRMAEWEQEWARVGPDWGGHSFRS